MIKAESDFLLHTSNAENSPQASPIRRRNKILAKIIPFLLVVGVCAISFRPVSKNDNELPSISATPKHIISDEMGESSSHPDSSNCTISWFEQSVDHFSFDQTDGVNKTFKQRYLVYDKYWARKTTSPQKRNGPIFFYCGNEGDVTLYANNTGLMWENAKDFGALIIFAEHRYYGKSVLVGQGLGSKNLKYLTHEQALADYAALIYQFKIENDAIDSPVIAFGGSYGGMLSAWFRMKYPSTIDGAISASAPILAFHGETPEFNGQSYWNVVTRDASPETGASKYCAPNIRHSWPVVFNLSKTAFGRQKLSNIFRLCEPLQTEAEGKQLAMSIMMAFDTMAMGNYPYPSSYLTGGAIDLPAWPMRKSCSYLDTDLIGKDDKLLAGLRDASNVFNNATQDLKCLKIPSLGDFDGIWDYQWCTEMLPQESYFSTDGINDMFWKRNISFSHIKNRCKKVWNVNTRLNWIRVNYGDSDLQGASNIVFSNGLLDPWSSGGVLKSRNKDIKIIKIKEGAHHLDLFFNHPKDPKSVKLARKVELNYIKKWVTESYKKKADSSTE